MAGGRGTRLRPFTAILPKPLVPIGDICILEMVLRQLRYYGFNRVILCVGHKAELIMAVIGDGRRFGLSVSYHRESEPLGTIGAVADMEDLDDNFLVMNGDVCTNLDFGKMLQAHICGGSVATIGTCFRREHLELGVLEANTDGTQVIGFVEKPTYDFLVSMGVNAFHRQIKDMIPRGKYFGFDMLMREMLNRKVPIRTHTHTGSWLDIGRPDDYNKMVEEFSKNPETYLPEGA